MGGWAGGTDIAQCSQRLGVNGIVEMLHKQSARIELLLSSTLISRGVGVVETLRRVLAAPSVDRPCFVLRSEKGALTATSNNLQQRSLRDPEMLRIRYPSYYIARSRTARAELDPALTLHTRTRWATSNVSTIVLVAVWGPQRDSNRRYWTSVDNQCESDKGGCSPHFPGVVHGPGLIT